MIKLEFGKTIDEEDGTERKTIFFDPSGIKENADYDDLFTIISGIAENSGKEASFLISDDWREFIVDAINTPGVQCFVHILDRGFQYGAIVRKKKKEAIKKAPETEA